ncbi:MAG: hypothetical protein SCH66_00925 [Methanolobus sp.]|nr:hypothetical protein [Methanolobus sp.]
MESFTDARPFVSDKKYETKRQKALSQLKEELEKGSVDPPIIELLKEFAKIPHCFTLQGCYGHFVHDKETNPHNVKPLSKYSGEPGKVRYRIAYMALCIQDNDNGKQLFRDLRDLTKMDGGFIQFGSADWFWERHVNSYAVQVEPERSKNTDSVRIDYDEALYIEKLKSRFFVALLEIAQKHQNLADQSDR